MGRRSGISADDTRRALLDATMRVLHARGYEGTRVSEIACEAGVTSGAIYNHFSSKVELLGTAISEQAPDVISALLDAAADGSVIDAFRMAGSFLPERASVAGPLMLELVVTSARDREVREIVAGGFAAKERDAAELIRTGQGSGEVDVDLEAEALVRFSTMLALGSLVVAVLELEPVDAAAWDAVIDRMLEAVRRRHEPGLR